MRNGKLSSTNWLEIVLSSRPTRLIAKTMASYNLLNISEKFKDIISGKNTLVGPNVLIGKGTKIGHNTIIEDNVNVGKNCFIGSNVILRNTIIEDNVHILDGAVVGKKGFGFIPRNLIFM